jgi:hypothetical protein
VTRGLPNPDASFTPAAMPRLSRKREPYIPAALPASSDHHACSPA